MHSTDLRIEVLMGSGGYWKMYNAISKCSLWSAYPACAWDLKHSFDKGVWGGDTSAAAYLHLSCLTDSLICFSLWLSFACRVLKERWRRTASPNLFLWPIAWKSARFQNISHPYLADDGLRSVRRLGGAHVAYLLSVSNHPSLLVHKRGGRPWPDRDGLRSS